VNQAIAHPLHLPIVWAIWKPRVASRLLLMGLGIIALVASAKVQIPAWPIPMTMQTYVILVIAMAYGSRLGLSTVAIYLAVGAAGFPVFAGTPEKGIGLAYMVGPTGGYLVGFFVATWACGWLAAKGWDRTVPKVLAVMTIGHLLILGIGVAWLGTLVGWRSAVALGFTPFIAATIVKTLLAAATLPTAWKLVLWCKNP